MYQYFHSQIQSILWNGNCCAIWKVNTVFNIVFPCHPTFFVSCLVRRCSLKESSHECKAILFDVRLSSKGVQDWVGTATNESKSRGHRTAGFRDTIQSAKIKPAFLIHMCQTIQMFYKENNFYSLGLIWGDFIIKEKWLKV